MPNWLRNGVSTGTQRSLGLSTSVEFRSPVAGGVPGVLLSTPPASVTDPVAAPLITAASLAAVDGDGHQLLGAVRCHRREGVGQRLARIERLHGRIAVVQRVGPHPGGGERVACRRCLAVGKLTASQATGSSTSASRSPVSVGMPGVPLATPPASTTVPVVSPTDRCRVVGAVDGDGHELRGAVDRGGAVNVSVSVSPALSACTAALVSSSV